MNKFITINNIDKFPNMLTGLLPVGIKSHGFTSEKDYYKFWFINKNSTDIRRRYINLTIFRRICIDATGSFNYHMTNGIPHIHIVIEYYDASGPTTNPPITLSWLMATGALKSPYQLLYDVFNNIIYGQNPDGFVTEASVRY